MPGQSDDFTIEESEDDADYVCPDSDEISDEDVQTMMNERKTLHLSLRLNKYLLLAKNAGLYVK